MPFKRLVVLTSICASTAWADAGPPFLTNDPGTPGAANWEINLSSAQTVARGSAQYQLPQLDVNFGVGDRIQLTVESAYAVATAAGTASQTGWSNTLLGVKWRFLDRGDDSWQLSTFPQYETGLSWVSQARGLGQAGPRVLLPLEISHPLAGFSVNFEAGAYVPLQGPSERILGLVVGRSLTERLELDAEIYDDRVRDEPSAQTTLDVGGRYQWQPGIIALFMAGRGVGHPGPARPQYIGFLGVQILLSDYGRRLRAATDAQH